jgi:hypothetical protein
MATAQLDTLVDIAVIVDKGMVRSLTRSVLITGLTATDGVTMAEQMLSASGLPAAGGAISVKGHLLYLENIEAKLIEGELTKATAVLSYARRDVSSSSAAGGGVTPTLRGGTALKQVTTAKDRQGNQIIVEHTWPADDDDDHKNKTQTQGGEISVLVPMSTVYGEFIEANASPGVITKAWAGHVNEDTWLGGAPRTWMCTSAKFELADFNTSPRTYRFAFEFEYDDQGWDNDTTAVFVDPRTGKPAADLVEGAGIKKIQYYPARNFGNTF